MTEHDPILSELNEPQREAILHEEGPLLVIAGAGSGKTRVITRRMAHLIRVGHSPYSILGLTFTNKAAAEMKERVDHLSGAGGVFISTFHSMGVRFLRMDGEAIGIPSNFTIYDSDDQKVLIKAVLKELNLDATHFRPKAVAEEISRLKNAGTSPEEAAASSHYFKRVVASVFQRYQEQIRTNRALDFDDLLLETLHLFQQRADVLARYQDRFPFILIDEYQDTNKVQYELARILAGSRMNLCATGDPDQSIYSWRGANIRNILEFERDFPGARVVKLEQNYRSTGNVLKAASTVIANNRFRKERSLWTESPDGEKITHYAALDEGEEAEFVARSVIALRQAGRSYSDFAIFYRTNALSRALERSFSLNNLPYSLVGGVEFYERREVKDLMAYLKLLDNPHDGVAFFRVVNTPPRSIGLRTLDQVRSVAAERRCSALEAVRIICREKSLPARQTTALSRFLNLFDTIQSGPDHSVEAQLQRVIQQIGFLDFLEASDRASAPERIDNVNELIYAVTDYDRHNPEGSLHGFLEETALIRGIDQWEEDSEKVVMMTLHAAKGLEFKVVFLVGFEEGMLPHIFSMDSDEGIEEERRLCYVGITRAREKLFITRSASRVRAGSISSSPVSRFLGEIPEDVIEHQSRFQKPVERVQYEAAGDQVLEYEFDEAPEFRSGDAVVHPYFGRGQVTHVSGSGVGARVKVKFRGLGEKLLLVKYAKLQKVL